MGTIADKTGVRSNTGRQGAWLAWNLLQLAFTLIWTCGWIVLALVLRGLRLISNDTLLRMAARLWAPGLVYGAGARLVVEGRDHVEWSRPYLVVSNHQSFIDICALFVAVPIPLCFLLKDQMLKVPFVNWYARAAGMLFLDRHSPRAGAKARRQAARLLQAGRTLCLFPEGTRSRTGALGQFKAGLLQSAIDAGVDVVPVALDGCGKVLPPAGLFRVRPGPMRVRIGKPIPTIGADAPGGRQALAARAHAEIARLLEPRL